MIGLSRSGLEHVRIHLGPEASHSPRIPQEQEVQLHDQCGNPLDAIFPGIGVVKHGPQSQVQKTQRERQCREPQEQRALLVAVEARCFGVDLHERQSQRELSDGGTEEIAVDTEAPHELIERLLRAEKRHVDDQGNPADETAVQHEPLGRV